MLRGFESEICVFLALFDQPNRTIMRGTRRRKSPFAHSFGGGADYSGLTAAKASVPVHVLFRINTDDPLVPVSLGRRTNWLPLLCAIRYGACAIGYKVVSNDKVAILRQSDTQPWDGFPYADYPETLPRENVRIGDNVYDASKPKDALFYGGIFGFDHLTEEQMRKIERLVVSKQVYDPEFDQETPGQFIRESCWPYVQGAPEEDCPNPNCKNHGQTSSLRTVAIFHESAKRIQKLWGPHCGNLQIIYQICSRCKAIQVTNQCT